MLLFLIALTLVASKPLNDEEGCVFGGETFKYNERFVDPECKGYCTCTGPGSFGCVSLCPPIGLPACRLDEKVVMEEMRVKSSNCSCTYPRCVKDEDYVTPPFPVTFPGKKASPEFHDDPTTTLPATEAPSTTETTTEADFGFEYKEGPLPTPYPTTTEAPITTEAFPPFHHCFILGKVYQDRETFVSEDCKGYCKCDKGSISCVSLCPPVGVECTADEKEVTVTEPVADVCTCQRPKCVARYDVIGNVVIEEDDSNDENEV